MGCCGSKEEEDQFIKAGGEAAAFTGAVAGGAAVGAVALGGVTLGIGAPIGAAIGGVVGAIVGKCTSGTVGKLVSVPAGHLLNDVWRPLIDSKEVLQHHHRTACAPTYTALHTASAPHAPLGSGAATGYRHAQDRARRLPSRHVGALEHQLVPVPNARRVGGWVALPAGAQG